MSAQDILKKLPSGGFFKVSAERGSPLAKDKRAAVVEQIAQVMKHWLSEGKTQIHEQ